MVRPEDIQKFLVGDLGWIEFHFHNFGVTCLVSANIFLAGIVLLPTGITGRCRQDSLQIAEGLFDTPKTARAKCCLLRAHQKQNGMIMTGVQACGMLLVSVHDVQIALKS